MQVLTKMSHLFTPQERGFHVLYRMGEKNFCPACGRSHWYIGRKSAECAFCATALDMADTGSTGEGTFFQRGRRA